MSSAEIDQSSLVVEQRAERPTVCTTVNLSLLSTSSRKKLHRSSVTTTTSLSSSSSSSSSSTRRRRPITSFQSMGTPPSSSSATQQQQQQQQTSLFGSTSIDNSPLNDLRQRLATIESVTSKSYATSRPTLKHTTIYDETIRATSPQSAPALLSNRTPKYYTCPQTRVIKTKQEEKEEFNDSPSLETTATIRLIANNFSLNANNDSNNSLNTLQVIELDPIVGRQVSSSLAAVAEPIVEVKGTSSSSSDSSADNSPKLSPISSRQSSDCELDKTTKTTTRRQLAKSSSSSLSSSSASSSRLIRSRTVRRSYHSRALEAETSTTSANEPRNSQSIITTTTTTKIAAGSPKSRSNSPQADRRKSSIPTRQFGDHLTVGQKKQSHHHHHHQLSTSTSSSKISTSSSSSKKLSTSTSTSSTSSKQVIKNQLEQDKMLATNNLDLKKNNSSGAGESLFERRHRNSTASVLLADIERASESRGALEIEQQEESSVHRRELSSFNASSSSSSRMLAAAGAANVGSKPTSAATATTAAIAASRSETSSTSSHSAIKTMSNQQQQQLIKSADVSSSSTSTSSSNFHKTSSLFLSNAYKHQQQQQGNSFLTAPNATVDHLPYSSPDVRSLVQEIGTDFAELENALSSTSFFSKQLHDHQQTTSTSSNLSTRLFGRAPSTRPLSPLSSLQFDASAVRTCAPVALKNEPEYKNNGTLIDYDPAADKEFRRQLDRFDEDNNTTTYPSISLSTQEATNNNLRESSRGENSGYNGERIRELLDKAQRHGDATTNGNTKNHQHVSSRSSASGTDCDGFASRPAPPTDANRARCKAVMSESIGRIDQKMSDLCKKLETCDDTQKAIDLLKIMIQMIEKAWSVPVCGDDLGFKLCNSLHQFGGLDILLGFIHEADDRSLVGGSSGGSQECDSAKLITTPATANSQASENQRDNQQQQQQQRQNKLRLNLSKIQQQQNSADSMGGDQSRVADTHPATSDTNQVTSSKSAPPAAHSCPSVGDNDSDILTSDLGLDSTSVESLSYVSANSGNNRTTTGAAPINTQTPPPSDDSVAGSLPTRTIGLANESGNNNDNTEKQINTDRDNTDDSDSEEVRRVRKDELVFLSAHLLSQCLTSENRDYIVNYGHLDPVIKLACKFTTMKSGHSKRLLKQSALMRRSSSMKQQQKQMQLARESTIDVVSKSSPKDQDSESKTSEETITDSSYQVIDQNKAKPESTTVCEQPQQQSSLEDNSNGPQEQRSDMHSAIGTEILQHLFKHSEETCSRAIGLGALQAILYGCRSSHIETLRHCASALANLALYGGSDSQQMMIEQKAHVWLFPLAFNEDDNVQYYACLAIVVLAANQEIEADVLQSSTLDLVEPFVTSHEPRKFAESTTSHIHGQSAGWLKKLMPLLESKREEARNLACFHFAMEAYIKREQGQTELFKEIGSIELLRKAGSSPIAIASKFACQALRLIGEREPHKLSQQVPLWTCDDVCEWVSQIGFDKFRQNFRDSLVDGDLLLTLDEQSLKFDLGIENGIIRRRFMRELGNLKRIADYSSVDRSGLGQLLVNSVSILNNSLKSNSGNPLMPACCPPSSAANRNARDFMQYIYPILQSGVTKDNIHLLDCEQLLADCKISNSLHRIKLAHSIREIQDRIIMDVATNEQNSLGGTDQKTLDVFVSYRRSTGSQLASLLKVHLQLRGFSVFIDVERLEAGKFDNNLLDSIKTAKNFILVLSPSALDRCIGDHECKDWVHKEIVAALASNCNIIPIIDNFHWPDPDQLPEDMRSITYFNGIRWIHDYQDACVDKVERFIRGELSNSGCGGSQTTGAGSIISSVSNGGGGGGGGGGNQTGQRLSSVCNPAAGGGSTPSIIATTPSLLPNGQMSFQQQFAHAKNQALDHSAITSISSYATNDHPLASAVTSYSANINNPYIQQHNLRLGNSNNNVRLQ